MPEAAGVRAYFASPIGLIRIIAGESGIRALDFVEGDKPPAGRPEPVLAGCLDQLDEYFRGQRRAFDVGLELGGTAFQKSVWGELLKIPFGGTATYASIAAALGRPRAVRAVGGANHRNPVSIIVPCHRVVGANGGLTGYGGGLWRKAWLLDHERGLL